jgi:hypothetical protein
MAERQTGQWIGIRGTAGGTVGLMGWPGRIVAGMPHANIGGGTKRSDR